MGSISRSGARIRGDDYQHIFAWIKTLQSLQPGTDVTAIGIEDPEAGSVDDVAVYRSRERNEFYQVKSSVDAEKVVNIEWLISPSQGGGPSILQRFYESWGRLTRNGEHPWLHLVTNFLPDPNDPVIVLRDGRDGTLSARLRSKGPRSSAGRMRVEMAKHLGISENELLEFLSDVRFTMGRLEGEWKEQAALLMYGLGLRHDEDAVQGGVTTVRGWVTGGRRRLTTHDIRQEIASLNLRQREPTGILLVQAIDRDPMPESATVALDWVDYFIGDEPRRRRRLHDIKLWNSRLRLELRGTVQKFRAKSYRSVLVRGYMRLPTWFTIGTEFCKTAGFDVCSFQGGDPWPSHGDVIDFPVTVRTNEVLGEGKDLAIGLSLSTDVSKDVLYYLPSGVPTAGRYVSIEPKGEPSNQSIRSDVEARGWAFRVRDIVRKLAREYRTGKLHLFLGTPHGAALLLGHLWDRMPCTQLYEDLGAAGGYMPSFMIPN